MAILAEVVDCLRHLEDTEVNGSHREDERRLVIANNLRLEIFHVTTSSELKLIIHCISSANNLRRNFVFLKRSCDQFNITMPLVRKS